MIRQGNYDVVAPFYDQLSHLIFGKAIVQSQQFLIKAIPTQSTILIVGGGTGWILEEITRKYREGLHITYIELSEKMTSLSKKKNTGNNKVIFINEAIQDANLPLVYDVVITTFLFDNFSDKTLTIIFEKIHQQLKRNGLWLFADFQVINNKLWQKVFLKTMYLFFGTLCNVETSKLPDINGLFYRHTYKAIAAQTFFKSFINAVVYQKS